MPSSRLVAASLSRPLSVANRIFESTGKVLLPATACPTIDSPRFRLSCKQVSFIAGAPFRILLLNYTIMH